jgi:transposase, IS5 family
LLAVAQASVQQAQQVQHWLAGWADATAQRLEAALQRTAPLVQQVIAQAERRVLRGESVPASAKLVSLFEPPRPSCGVAKATYRLSSVARSCSMKWRADWSRYAVLAGNPPDAPELPTSLAHHQACFARAPAVLTADRAFFTWTTINSRTTSASAQLLCHVRDH